MVLRFMKEDMTRSGAREGNKMARINQDVLLDGRTLSGVPVVVYQRSWANDQNENVYQPIYHSVHKFKGSGATPALILDCERASQKPAKPSS